MLHKLLSADLVNLQVVYTLHRLVQVLAALELTTYLQHLQIPQVLQISLVQVIPLTKVKQQLVHQLAAQQLQLVI